MKRTFIPFVFMLFLLGCSETENTLPEYTGLHIFLTDDTMVTTVLSIEDIQPENKAFISYDEIVSYDTSKHILKLDHSVDTLFTCGHLIDMRGFVVMLDEIPIYCGVFYSPVHSAPNPNIVITTPCDDNPCDSCLQIIEGYPHAAFYEGSSQINDPRIIEFLMNDNKIK